MILIKNIEKKRTEASFKKLDNGCSIVNHLLLAHWLAHHHLLLAHWLDHHHLLLAAQHWLLLLDHHILVVAHLLNLVKLRLLLRHLVDLIPVPD